jgi:hypothetical protein
MKSEVPLPCAQHPHLVAILRHMNTAHAQSSTRLTSISILSLHLYIRIPNTVMESGFPLLSKNVNNHTINLYGTKTMSQLLIKRAQ